MVNQQQLTQWVDHHQEQALEQLYALLRLPTMAHIDAANPALHECAHLLEDMLLAIGATDVSVAGSDLHPLVLGSIGSDPAKPTLLMYGHFDVEDPGPQSLWESPPFEPEIRDGRIFARGTGDNKGQFLSYFLAVQAYRDCEIELPVNLKFVLDGAEEIGSPSLAMLRETNPEAMETDLVFCADGTVHESGRPKIVLGSRGVVYLEITIRTLRRSSHSQYASVLPNASWRAVEVLNSLRDTSGRCAIKGFYDNVVVPSPAEMTLLHSMPPIADALAREFEPQPPFPTRSTEEFNYQLLMEPYLNIAGITTGDAVSYTTVVPDSAVIKMDIGIVPNQTPEEITEKVRQYLSTFGIPREDVRVIFVANPTITPVDHPLVQPMADALHRGWGDPPVIVNRFGGYSGHHHHWDMLGIKAISASYGQPDQSNHAPNENLALDNFYKGILATAALYDAVGSTGYRRRR